MDRGDGMCPRGGGEPDRVPRTVAGHRGYCSGRDRQGVLVTTVSPVGLVSVWRLDDHANLVEWAAPSVRPGQPKTQDCAGTDCYRVMPGRLIVQASHDGGQTFVTVWAVTGPAYERLVADYGGVRPVSLSVAVRPSGQGPVVFVANGRDGVLYGNTAGVWRRLGVPMGGEGIYFQRPPRLSTDPKPWDAGPLVGVVVGFSCSWPEH